MLSAELHVHIHVQFNWLVISASSPRTAHEKWPGNYHFIRYHCYHCDRITYQFHHNFILSSSWWYSFFHLLRWALVITDHNSLSRDMNCIWKTVIHSKDRKLNAANELSDFLSLFLSPHIFQCGSSTWTLTHYVI